MPSDISLGKTICLRRKRLSLTQAQLADLAGCSPLFISEVERGKESVQMDKLLSVLRALGLQLRLESGHAGLVIEAE